MTLDCTKPGYYKTRSGKIAQVAGHNPKAKPDFEVCGWLNGTTTGWSPTGKYSASLPYDDEDLVEYIGVEMMPRKVRPFRVGDVTTTREGNSARVICVDQKGSSFPILALVTCSGWEIVFRFQLNGNEHDDRESPNDLMPMYEDDEVSDGTV